ncbi:MAG: class I SAM-dependent methyltransferase [Gammaproteobacteria bacterium]|nr:class I SAM-dependent methyltransferase [Gammaproteobacteria bacterium]
MNDQLIDFYRREHCPGCASKDIDTVYQLSYADESLKQFIESFYQQRMDYRLLEDQVYEMGKCPHCGLLFQRLVLNQTGQAALYGEWVDSQKSLEKKRYAKAKLFRQYAGQLETVSRLFPQAPHKIEILEFGMGWGYWSRMATAYGYHVRGLELSPERVEHARSLGVEVMQELPEPSPRFDFIYASQVFEHLEDPLQTMTELSQRLKPDGIIYLRVPDARGLEGILKANGWQPEMDAIHPLEHINAFTRKSLSVMASKAGFRVIQPPLRIDISKFWSGLKREIGDRWLNTHVYLRKQ